MNSTFHEPSRNVHCSKCRLSACAVKFWSCSTLSWHSMASHLDFVCEMLVGIRKYRFLMPLFRYIVASAELHKFHLVCSFASPLKPRMKYFPQRQIWFQQNSWETNMISTEQLSAVASINLKTSVSNIKMGLLNVQRASLGALRRSTARGNAAPQPSSPRLIQPVRFSWHAYCLDAKLCRGSQTFNPHPHHSNLDSGFRQTSLSMPGALP